MLSQAALESLYSATYVEDYFDGMENLPDDVQRKVSQILELNVTLKSLIGELESNMSYLMENLGKVDSTPTGDKTKKRMYKRMQQILMMTQEIGDEKLQLGQQIQDLMENKVQQLNLDKKNIDLEKKQQEAVETVREPKLVDSEDRPMKRARRARHEVFVPSILGPATLEATSFSQISDTPSTSMSSSISSHLVKSQSYTNPQSSPSRVSSATKKDDVDVFSSPQKTKAEGQLAHSGAAAAPSVSTEPVVSAPLRTDIPSKKVTANRSANAGTSAEGSSSLVTAPSSSASAVPTDSPTKGESSAAEPSTSQSTQPIGTAKNSDWKYKCSTKPKKEKRGKKRRSMTKQPVNIPVDPDEPLYCLCDQVSYGDMIGCDNDLCPIEWFHFSCVGLTTKPKGKWFCPKCRGDRPNVMKPKAIFLKELEIYNRLKEESC